MLVVYAVYWLATHRPLKLRSCKGAAFCSAHTNMDHYCSQVPASYTLYDVLAVPDIAVCLCTLSRQVILTADCELGSFELC